MSVAALAHCPVAKTLSLPALDAYPVMLATVAGGTLGACAVVLSALRTLLAF